MRILLSSNIHEFVSALLLLREVDIHIPDNAKRHSPIKDRHVHVIPSDMVCSSSMMAEYVLEHKIQIVYAQGRSDLLFYAKVGTLLKGRHSFKILVTAHTGYIWCSWRKSLVFMALAKVYSNGLIFLSTTHLRRYRWVANLMRLKTWVVCNPVDLLRFEKVGKHVKHEHSPFKLGYVGVITPNKGQDILIEALVRLRKMGIRATLFLIGDIRDEEYYEKLVSIIESHALGECVKIVSGLPYCEMPTFMSGLDCYACPSKIEVMPFNILEAMACALPIVASKVGGIPDLVQNGYNGYLCEHNNPICFAENIERLLLDNRISEYGKNSRKKVECEFESHHYAQMMWSIMSPLVDGQL